MKWKPFDEAGVRGIGTAAVAGAHQGDGAAFEVDLEPNLGAAPAPVDPFAPRPREALPDRAGVAAFANALLLVYLYYYLGDRVGVADPGTLVLVAVLIVKFLPNRSLVGQNSMLVAPRACRPWRAPRSGATTTGTWSGRSPSSSAAPRAAARSR